MKHGSDRKNAITTFKIKESFLKLVDRNHLTALVVAAAWAGDVGRSGATALGAHIELARTPALTAATKALLHFRRFTFWDCHSELKNWLDAHLSVSPAIVNV